MFYFIKPFEHNELLPIVPTANRAALDRLRDRVATVEDVEAIAKLIAKASNQADALRFRRGVLAEPLNEATGALANPAPALPAFAAPVSPARPPLPLTGPALPMFRQMVTAIPAKSLADLLMQISPEYVAELLIHLKGLTNEP